MVATKFKVDFTNHNLEFEKYKFNRINIRIITYNILITIYSYLLEFSFIINILCIPDHKI